MAEKAHLEQEGKNMRTRQKENMINDITNVTAKSPEQLSMILDALASTTEDPSEMNENSMVSGNILVIIVPFNPNTLRFGYRI